MVFINQQLWIIIVFVQLLIIHAFTQMVMQAFQPPMIVMPQIHIVAMPQDEVNTTSTTTTTTTEGTFAVAVPVPVPMSMPIQIAIPAQPPPSFCQGSPRPRGCPPCPPCLCTPSCTPSFFSYCSPCHQKCRCRNSADAPIPQPLYPPQPAPGPAFPMPFPAPPFALPVPQPAPIAMAPYPPPFRWHQQPRPKSPDYSESECDTDSSDSSSSSDWYVAKKRNRKIFRSNRKDKRGRKGRRRHQRIKRRNIPRSGYSDGEFVKPALTYITRNGDVKFQKEINNVEAALLLEENGLIDGRITKYQVLTGHGIEPQSFEESSTKLNVDEVSFSDMAKKQVFIGNGKTGRILKKGKKELIFRTPVDKKITNVSLSFDVV